MGETTLIIVISFLLIMEFLSILLAIIFDKKNRWVYIASVLLTFFIMGLIVAAIYFESEIIKAICIILLIITIGGIILYSAEVNEIPFG
jgi:uncharacterized membrane protein YqjE